MTIVGILLFSCFTLGVVVYSSLTEVVKRNEADSIERRMAGYLFAYQNGGIVELGRLVEFQRTRTPDEKTGIILENSTGVLYRSMEDFGNFRPDVESPGLHIELKDERGMDHHLKKYILEKRWTVLLKFFNFEVVYIQKKEISPGLSLTFLQTFPNVERDFERVRMLGLSLLLIFLFMGILLGYTLSRRVIRPIRAFIGTIDLLEKGDGSARVNLSEGNEFDSLADEFNRLMDSKDTLVKGMNDTLDTVAHEIRTPLTRFRISAEDALNSKGSNEEYENVIRGALDSTEQISFLLTTILESARANSGLINLNKDTFPIAPFLVELNDIYTFLLEEKNLSLKFELQEGMNILADKRLLFQAVNNLLDNAIKFSPEGGIILIKVSRLEQEIRISVSDSGPGIDLREQAKIWQRLYRSEGNSAKGYGIGLSVVKSIIDLHSGTVSVESETGKGCTFTIYLPTALP